MRLTRRYIFAVIIITSLFWLFMDFTAFYWKKNNKNFVSSSEKVTIEYFEQFYKTILNPQPGSAGMDGQAVINPQDEKEKEDKGLLDYGFNELSSSKISLERTIPDNRHRMYVAFLTTLREEMSSA